MGLFSKKNNNTKESAQTASTKPAVNVQNVPDDIDPNELAAVIAAAIYVASTGRSTYNLQVRSIRRQNSSAPAWNTAARRENIDVRF